MEAKSIGCIAEELGVNFYHLQPYILMREREARKEVVKWVEENCPEANQYWHSILTPKLQLDSRMWQAQKKEWGL